MHSKIRNCEISYFFHYFEMLFYIKKFFSQRVFAEDVGSCVNCGGRMELRAVVIRPPATIKVLTSLVGEGLGRDPPVLE